MDAANASLGLLAEFDAPAARGTTLPGRTRGVGWVLQWFAALATLLFAASTLTQFGYCLAAELALTRAARAAALEATLPRATSHSVTQTIDRRLADYPHWRNSRLRLSVHQNGAPLRGRIRAREGDLFCVTLAAPARDVLPRWLRTVCFWRSDSQIEVRAERQIPSRELPRR
jgi:hypothetical protein